MNNTRDPRRRMTFLEVLWLDMRTVAHDDWRDFKRFLNNFNPWSK